MRRSSICFSLIILLTCLMSASATTGRIIKVLPHYLDMEGRHALSPSLYDRDAYQAQLRRHPDQCSAIRFDVQWKAKASTVSPAGLKLRVELRGTAKGGKPRQTQLETEVKPSWFSKWTSLMLAGEDYKKFGEVVAWRATLWDGDQLVGEQKSFLW